MNLKYISENYNRNDFREVLIQFKNKFPNSKRNLTLIFLLVVLIVVILLPTSRNKGENKDTSEETLNCDLQYAETLQNNLCDFISSIEGAGKTKVFLTLDCSEENIYASDIKDEKKEYVVIKAGSDQKGMLLKIRKPVIKGVAVVCEGGDSPSVKIEIIKAVASSLGVSSNKISISKMKYRSD